MKSKIATYICYAIMITFSMVLTSYGPLLPSISNTFSLSLAQSGIIFTANFVGFVLFVLIGGVLADRIGKKTILSTSLLGFALSLLLFPIATNFYTSLFIMFLIGGFGGVIETVLSSIISDLNIKNSSFYLNLLQVFFGIGAIIGPILSGFVVSSGIKWQSFYYFMGTLTLLLVIILFVSKFPELIKSDRISMEIFKYLLTDKKFLLLCLCMALYTGSEVGSWGLMSIFLKENMGFQILKSSIAVAVFWASLTIGRLICGPLTLRFNIKTIILILAASSSILCIFSGLVTNELAAWLILIALGLGFSSQWPLIAAYGSKQYDKSSATVFALLIGSGGLGTAIIPYVLGIIGEKVNTRIAVASPSVFFIVIVIIFVYIDKLKPRQSRN